MSKEYYKKYEPLFGYWKIKDTLGEGSFGEVFRIEREDFGRTYQAALKAITIPKNENDIKRIMSEGMDEKSASIYFRGFVEEMTEEFAIMDKLKGNTNIVSYEDHVVIPHQAKIGWDILIRMELLTTLTDYLQTHQFSEQDVIKLGIDICNALELCERYNIIHRDIKPDNIFISEVGNFKLGDFGIARVAEKTTGASTKIGTNSYMAPEIMRGITYTFKVDIYSLGLVLYKLLNNNRLPFLPPAPEPITFSKREAANTQRMSGVAVLPPANGSEDLKKAVLKALEFNPDNRYDNAAAMRLALEALNYSGNALQMNNYAAITISGHDQLDSTNDFNEFEDDKTIVAASSDLNTAPIPMSSSTEGNSADKATDHSVKKRKIDNKDIVKAVILLAICAVIGVSVYIQSNRYSVTPEVTSTEATTKTVADKTSAKSTSTEATTMTDTNDRTANESETSGANQSSYEYRGWEILNHGYTYVNHDLEMLFDNGKNEWVVNEDENDVGILYTEGPYTVFNDEEAYDGGVYLMRSIHFSEYDTNDIEDIYRIIASNPNNFADYEVSTDYITFLGEERYVINVSFSGQETANTGENRNNFAVETKCNRMIIPIVVNEKTYLIRGQVENVKDSYKYGLEDMNPLDLLSSCATHYKY